MLNILIPNIGRRGYLVKYLKQTNSIECKVFVSDCDNTASGLYGNNDGSYLLPRPIDNEKEYIDALLQLCKKKSIRIIIPVIDPEIYILSKYQELFKKSNIFISVSSKEVLDICYNKLEMNDFLHANGFSFPRTYSSISEFMIDFEKEFISFPVIIKPVFGSGSISTYIVDNSQQLNSLYTEDMIIQEYINGTEFGIDVFNNLNYEPVRCIIKKKISMRSGETDKSEIVKDIQIQNTILHLATRLKHICNLDCDIIKANDRIYIIDLNPRLGGGYPATHESGTNLLELIYRIANNESITADFTNTNIGMIIMKEIGIVTTKELIK